MSFKNVWVQSASWVIPGAYACAAVVLGMTLPRIETRLFPHLGAAMSVPAATAIYSSIATGMISLTAIVFSLTLVMLQFSATAYSPRLVLWILRDRFMAHALGLFTATSLYAIAALAWVDRSASGKVPFITGYLPIALLLGCVVMFVSVIQRVGLFHIIRMLTLTGDQGRKVIAELYPPLIAMPTGVRSHHYRARPRQVLIHRGRPRAIQAVNIAGLVGLARESDVVIEVVAAVGDTVVELTPLVHVFGSRQAIPEKALRQTITLAAGRTFEQDPKYAIRLLVDIAIKALSPAVNDPTTAVQALDQIGDLLLRLGHRRLEIGEFRDSDGHLRVVVPFPTWEDYLRLAFDEIRSYGAGSVQVMRRMNALVSDLIALLPQERHQALKHWHERLQLTVARSFANDVEEQCDASVEDRQGLGRPYERAAHSSQSATKT